jgi:2'-5' RNA ligase
VGPIRARRLKTDANAPHGQTRSLRCFIALQPDAAARTRLDELAREQQAAFPTARRMRPENLHLTLAFIGALEEARAHRVADLLAQTAFAAFRWSLDEIGAFGGARVLWVGGADSRLAAVADLVRRLLDEQRVAYDRKPFVGHVTLLRNLPREAARRYPQKIEPAIAWPTAAPVLLHSTTNAEGVRYMPVTRHTGDG